MTTRRFSGGMYDQGRSYAPGQWETISGMTVSPTFFETMEIPLVAGRGFTERDDNAVPRVVVINEAAARQYFPNENPIGRRIGSTLEGSGRQEIVGILRDAKYNSVRDRAAPTRYAPYLQSPQGSATFEVRTAGDPLAAIGSIREAVRQIDPDLPLIDVTTQAEQVERRFLQEKVFAQAYALFGGLALLVASVGLFGLMSYSIARRTNEIGIRMALGAARRDVRRLVMALARTATTRSTPATVKKTHGDVALTPNSSVVRNRVRPSEAAMPMAMPAPVSRTPRNTTMPSTSVRLAPSAIRTPTSRVRCAT